MTEQVDRERWLPVVGHEDLYEVSDLGRVRRAAAGHTTHAGRILKGVMNDGGYIRVTLGGSGSREQRYIHHLVLEAFVGPRPEGMEGCHFPNPDPADNRLDNLRWDTSAGNSRDQAAHGSHWSTRKTHCVRGHSLAGAPMGSDGYRYCPLCRVERKAERLLSPTLEHGTQKAYSYGCRCEPCVDEYAIYQKAKRAAREGK